MCVSSALFTDHVSCLVFHTIIAEPALWQSDISFLVGRKSRFTKYILFLYCFGYSIRSAISSFLATIIIPYFYNLLSVIWGYVGGISARLDPSL